MPYWLEFCICVHVQNINYETNKRNEATFEDLQKLCAIALNSYILVSTSPIIKQFCTFIYNYF
jgi:hypothetical protein